MGSCCPGKENDMIKKIIAAITALTLAAAVFTSCGKTDDSQSAAESAASDISTASSESDSADTSDTAESTASSQADESAAEAAIPEPSLTIDGEKVDTSNIVMCTVDGNDIDFDLFRYYYYYVMNQMYLTPETLTEENFATFKEYLIKQLKSDYTTIHLAKENNITLTEESNKNIEEKISTIKSNYKSDEEYQNALKASYLTEAAYRKMLETAELYSLVESQLLTNEGKYATKKDDFKKIVQDSSKYSRVVHILIPYYSQAEITDEETVSSYESMTLSEKMSAKQAAYNALSDEEKEKVKEKAKKVADDVLKKAKDGEDFSKLITEYGWDPGMESSPEGYYINSDTPLVQEFKDKSFELKENEISDLVENDTYGWFIIKRLPIDMDYVEENLENMIINYDSPAINKLFTKINEELEFKESEYMEKLTYNSIT